jgi:hypothetical protein
MNNLKQSEAATISILTFWTFIIDSIFLYFTDFIVIHLFDIIRAKLSYNILFN